MTPNDWEILAKYGVTPDNLAMNGSINLSDRTSLTNLPNGLSVSGSLDLSGCTGLTSLPKDLRVGD